MCHRWTWRLAAHTVRVDEYVPKVHDSPAVLGFHRVGAVHGGCLLVLNHSVVYNLYIAVQHMSTIYPMQYTHYTVQYLSPSEAADEGCVQNNQESLEVALPGST